MVTAVSDLTELRDHARRLAESAHVDDCLRIHRITKLLREVSGYDFDVTLSCSSEVGHDPHEWRGPLGAEYACPGLCGGCMTEPERALWRQIAAEVGAHLDRPDDKEQGALPL